MTIDIDAIATAIAARYAPGLLAPPAGLEAIMEATADLPNAITATPAVLVFTESGTLDPGNGTRLGVAVFRARFYLEPGVDLAQDEVQLRQWLKLLLDVHGTSMQLGGLITAVRTIGWKIGILTYDTETYSGIELVLQVVTSEAWSPTA